MSPKTPKNIIPFIIIFALGALISYTAFALPQMNERKQSLTSAT